MKHSLRPANCLCPVCGDEGVIERIAAGREYRAHCASCAEVNSFAPVGSADAVDRAVDRWIHAAERAVLRGAA
jgi:uncharacterized Zn finger protein